MSDRLQRFTDPPPQLTHASTATLPPPNGAAQAWESVQAEASALHEGDVESPRVDLQSASETVLQVVTAAQADGALMERFGKVVAIGELGAGAFTRLITLANAAWYARHCQIEAEAVDATTALDAVVTEAEPVRERMLTLATYYFARHADERARVKQVQGLRGARQLPNALVSLADLYERHPAIVSSDRQHYRATDVRDARRLAEDIRRKLGSAQTDARQLWTDRSARVWTLLTRAYDEVQETGRWLLRKQPEAAVERFPSLVATVRSATRPKRKQEQATGTPGTTPGAAPTPDANTAPKPARRRRRKR